MTAKRPLVSEESVAAALAYDRAHRPDLDVVTPGQARRIIHGWLLWLADTLRENAP